MNEEEIKMEEKYAKFKKELEKRNINVDVLQNCMIKAIMDEYIEGWNEGVDEHWMWIQCAIEKLIEEGAIEDKEIFDKIYTKVDSITNEEFLEWRDKRNVDDIIAEGTLEDILSTEKLMEELDEEGREQLEIDMELEPKIKKKLKMDDDEMSE